MNFLIKIENFINYLLVRLGEVSIALVLKLIPKKVKTLGQKVASLVRYFFTHLKEMPALILKYLKIWVGAAKTQLLSFNYKQKILDTYQTALSQYKSKNPETGVNKFKTALMAPFLIISEWLRGLSTIQALLLLSFTAGSFLASVSIFFTGQRLVSHEMDKYRSPASVEEEVLYERPDYYKKPTRHFDLTNLRLPVYIAEVNGIRSVDIDFTATVSNRKCRMFLEKYEFQLRDHLILHVEPLVASFPLEEEGKEVIRQKLLVEINDFIKSYEGEAEGFVTDLKLTYILAN